MSSSFPIESLYVHVPFCAQKCAYCAFYSEASSGELVNRYVASLIREMEMLPAGFKPRTIFFGGGTPSLLNLRQWQLILEAMDRLQLLGAPEWTVECNPATVSHDKIQLLRDYGVNRISLGVQSLDNDTLDRLGRIHSRDAVFKSVDVLRQAGIDNLNIDLMFAVPGQTLDMWRTTLNDAVALGSEHLACYEVIYEEDTPLFAQLQAGRFTVDEDLACAMYEELMEHASGAGLVQYEVANFARDERIQANCRGAGCEESPRPGSELPADIPRFACRHNVNYWRGGSFFGLGPSATSYVGGIRTKNWSNTKLYCELLENGKPATESSEELPPLRRAGETAAFGLRMLAGWGFEEFQQRTGHDLRQSWAREMNQLAHDGRAALTVDGFRLTRYGLRFADAAAELFLR